jgi:adenylyl-sulfate kinase
MDRESNGAFKQLVISQNMINYRPLSVWISGIPCAGKSTLAKGLVNELAEAGYKTILLDADEVRGGMNRDLDLSDKGREENIRRVAELNRLLLVQECIVVNAFIVPYQRFHEMVKGILGVDSIFQVYLNPSLETCIHRDVKGLYHRAMRGEIQGLTGYDANFEPPLDADITLDTGLVDLHDCICTVHNKLMAAIK